MKAKFLFLCLLLALCSCSQKRADGAGEGDLEHSCPQADIVLQPLGEFTRAEAERLLPELRRQFDEFLYGQWRFTVADPVALPQESKVAGKQKYQSTPLLNLLKSRLRDEEIIIGLTHRDICTAVHGVPDYGIVGISRPHRQVCMVSDKRLTDKSLYWKPILHEFMHTFYGSPHCPNDDPKCFMKDAKGHGNFVIQNHLCGACRR